MNTDANKEQRALEHIQSVVDKLLDPEGGCPWDRAQTPVSLCEYIIEECHELVDAIRSGKPGHACDEMGDLLFLLIITARRFADAGSFSLADALNAGADKMTRRHPHVFGDAHFASQAEFARPGRKSKRRKKRKREKGTAGFSPPYLPACLR